MPERYAVWLNRDVLRVAGPESEAYLQGQVSQDIAGLAPGECAWSWVLAPNGKVDSLVRVTRLDGDGWLLDTDGGWGQPLVDRLTRFKLRTKVDIERIDWSVLGLRGTVAPVDPGAPVDPESVAVPPWPGVIGADLIGESPTVAESSGSKSWPTIDPGDYEPERILAGIPRMGAELTEKTIPAETGLVGMTVSFTKGCYTGQELVARIDSRGGHVPRHLRLLMLSGPAEPGTSLQAGSSEGGSPDVGSSAVGVLTSVAHSEREGWVALGYVRRGIDPPATLTAGAVEALVRPLPVSSP